MMASRSTFGAETEAYDVVSSFASAVQGKTSEAELSIFINIT